VISARRLVPIVALALAATACAHRSRTVPEGRGRTLVALLPDPDSGAVGRANASGLGGSVELAEARASTIVSGRAAPTPVKILNEADSVRLFNEALTALPLTGASVLPLWPKAGEPARRVLVQARKGSGAAFCLLPGLILHDTSGAYTQEADAILRGQAALALGVPRL